jgi:aminopeptidase N
LLQYGGHLDNRESDFIHTAEAVLCSYWYPHIARLPARTTVTFTTPPGWKGLAQGELVGETHSPDGATTSTWRNEVPNCFFTLDIGRYTIANRTFKNRTLSVYQLKPNSVMAQACLDTLAAAIDYYERTFAAFPYSRYAIVETQAAFPGALEAYSFATFGPNTLPELIPHELAHTWWGGMIPCTYTHSMWDEAFAEYSDDLFSHARRAPASNVSSLYPASIDLLEERRKKAASYAILPVSQAFDTEDDRQIAVGYDKGRQVLKVLEAQLGQPLMLRCMRRFFAEHPKGEAADWPEFEAAVEKETRTDFRWFFAEWIERKGLPVLTLAHTTFQREGDGYLVETDVLQEGSPYRLRLPILLETAGRPALLIAKEVDGASTHLSFHVAAVPTRLRLDPAGEVPFAPPLGSPTESDPTLFLFRP